MYPQHDAVKTIKLSLVFMTGIAFHEYVKELNARMPNNTFISYIYNQRMDFVNDEQGNIN